MQHLHLALMVAVVLALLICGECFAAIRPSFSLEYSAWHASDIVVVARGAEPGGKVTVLETWKGSLSKGDSLTVPGLPEGEPEVSQMPFGGKEPAVTAVSGQRMILFLVRQATNPKAPADAGGADKPSQVAWGSADLFGGMNVSMVWVEKGQVYNFSQIKNPGPSLLVARNQTEEQFKKQVDAVLADQIKVQKVLAIKDPSERARTLKPMAAGVNTDLQQAAMNGVAACGKQGLPVLREMLADDAYYQSCVVNSLVKALGDEAGPELTAILKQDLEYWRKLGPTLPVGWWNANARGNSGQTLIYQNRYGRLYTCLCSLRALKYAEAAEVVTALRDFWRSLPQLEDKSGLNQISQECDAVLKAILPPDARGQ